MTDDEIAWLTCAMLIIGRVLGGIAILFTLWLVVHV